MFKIFALVYSKDKIIKKYDLVGEGAFDGEKLFEYLSNICYALDIGVPVVLGSHKLHLNKFNHTKFQKTDFVEPISFTRLVLQKFEE